jgi:hypothetical protein
LPWNCEQTTSVDRLKEKCYYIGSVSEDGSGCFSGPDLKHWLAEPDPDVFISNELSVSW